MRSHDEFASPIHSATKPPYHILVVDDEPEIRKLNAEVLMDAGYVVNAVENGAAAWKTLQRDRYDLLVTDNMMPGMSGVELLKKLHHYQYHVPVIMATGTLPPVESICQPWFAGITVLSKPYSLVDLLAAVENGLHRSQGWCCLSGSFDKPDGHGA